MPVEVLENTKRERIDVRYSLYHGNPVDLTLTMQLHIAQGTNFLDIMRLAQERSPNYRYEMLHINRMFYHTSIFFNYLFTAL